MQEQFDELRKALNMSTPTDSGITSLVKPAPLRLPQPDEQQVSKVLWRILEHPSSDLGHLAVMESYSRSVLLSWGVVVLFIRAGLMCLISLLLYRTSPLMARRMKVRK